MEHGRLLLLIERIEQRIGRRIANINHEKTSLKLSLRETLSDSRRYGRQSNKVLAVYSD
jgi:sulfur transfer protein SufE